MLNDHVVNVFLTIDAEVWPREDDWRSTGLARDIERYFYGRTPRGPFGIPYQLEQLSAHGLRGVYFMEPLFTSEVGTAALARIVELIERSGHEVQLHLHTEWLAMTSRSPITGRTGTNMRNLGLEDQSSLIAYGSRTLADCGARRVNAFRAGNFGANADTLVALARNGFDYDSSYNCAMGETGPSLGQILHQPAKIHGVWEFPVSVFRDLPGHYRPLHLCACSSAELEHALEQAWLLGWYAVVIVLHSFELLKRDNLDAYDRIVVRRFDRLCRYLDDHRDKFHSVGFRDLPPAAVALAESAPPLKSNVLRTTARWAEQAMSRLL